MPWWAWMSILVPLAIVIVSVRREVPIEHRDRYPIWDVVTHDPFDVDHLPHTYNITATTPQCVAGDACQYEPTHPTFIQCNTTTVTRVNVIPVWNCTSDIKPTWVRLNVTRIHAHSWDCYMHRFCTAAWKPEVDYELWYVHAMSDEMYIIPL